MDHPRLKFRVARSLLITKTTKEELSLRLIRKPLRELKSEPPYYL
nr:MAG TPA: hypothetical protein [Caudoviricetes sp.]